MAQYRPITEQLFADAIVKRFSKEEKIISDLFDAAERYSPPELREPNDNYIDEAALYAAAEQALSDLLPPGDTSNGN